MGLTCSRKRAKKHHVCTLGFGSDSMLPKIDGNKGKFHNLKKALLISDVHPDTSKYFSSYPAMVAERQRHILEGIWIIHPCSLLNLIWCTIMVFVNLAFVTLAPYRFAFIIPTLPAPYSPLDTIMPVLKAIVFLDIFCKLNTGYRSRHEVYIVLQRKRVVLRYLLRWGVIDLISCLPMGSVIPFFQPSLRTQLFLRLLPCIRCVRLHTISKDFKIFIKLLRIKYIHGRCLRHILLVIISIHWCSCLAYFPAIIDTYWKGYLSEAYSQLKILNTPANKRYESALFLTCTAFYGTPFGTFRSEMPGEIILNAIVVLYGQLLLVYTIIMMLKMYFVCYDSTMKYQELMDQVEKYMRNKEFSLQMVQRVRDFYNYRYQRQYFKEDFVLDCLSEQLRNEIFLDTCHKLIDTVSLFEGLPASVVGSVLGCLKAEIYMRNDLIVKAGDNGDCMYFIANGTVAVYSLKGAEVCHLDDGAHFGEIALLMKDRKRVATVVAIEITKVYRLDIQGFRHRPTSVRSNTWTIIRSEQQNGRSRHQMRDFIMTYNELYERIQERAAKRMHKTVLIDKEFKQKLLPRISIP